MSNRISASRYAKALLEVARSESDPAAVQQHLGAVLATIRDNGELAAALSSRHVPDAARRNIILAVADKLGVAPPVRKLLALLAERRRLELLSDLASEYAAGLLEYQNVVQAEVQTAAPLAPEAVQALEASLARATGKQVAMRVTPDPSLLGGIVARVGSTVYDGSVRTQLKKMRDQLVAQD